MNIDTRLRKLEATMTLKQPMPWARGIMDYGDDGHSPVLELAGKTFTPQAGETEEQMVDRAMREAGKCDHSLILRQLVRAENGRPAPGFERFAARDR